MEEQDGNPEAWEDASGSEPLLEGCDRGPFHAIRPEEMLRMVAAHLNRNERMIAQTSFLLLIAAYFISLDSGPGTWEEQHQKLLRRKEDLLVRRDRLRHAQEVAEKHKVICEKAGKAALAVGVTVVLWKLLFKSAAKQEGG